MSSSVIVPAKNPGGLALTPVKGWVLATVVTGFMFLLRLGTDSFWANRLPYGGFFLGCLVVIHYAETVPSLFAIFSGFLLGNWFFVTPQHSFAIANSVDRLSSAVYLTLCLVILFYTLRTRRAMTRERDAWAATGRLAAIIESSEDAIIGRSLDGKIVSWNGGARNLYGYTEAEAKSQPAAFLMEPEKASGFALVFERVGKGEQIRHLETVQLKKNGELVEVSLSVSPVRNNAGEIVGVSTIAREIGERKRAERERERLLSELQRLLGEVKTLTGLLPICAYCKKIRDDNGYWNQIELYIGQRSRANFTHSVCPDCASDQYAQFFDEKAKGL